MAYDPTSKDRIHAAEALYGRRVLVDKPFPTVTAAGLDLLTGPAESHIFTLAPKQWLLHPIRIGRRWLKTSGKEIRVVRIEMP